MHRPLIRTMLRHVAALSVALSAVTAVTAAAPAATARVRPRRGGR